MKQFIIELDEMVCVWLSHISDVTGESIKNLIAGGIYRQITALEDSVSKAFGIREAG